MTADYGTPVAYLQKMVAAWQQFDWLRRGPMNLVPNFVTESTARPCTSSMSGPKSPALPRCC